MRVEGACAAKYRAVRLDTYADVTQHPLTLADDQTGEVFWTDKHEQQHRETLGPHAIRLLRRPTY